MWKSEDKKSNERESLKSNNPNLVTYEKMYESYNYFDDFIKDSSKFVKSKEEIQKEE